MWETHPNDYWVFSKMADFSTLIPGPPLSKMVVSQISQPGDVQDVKFPTHVCFTGANH